MDSLTDLPPELLLMIGERLEDFDISFFRLCCRIFYSVSVYNGDLQRSIGRSPFVTSKSRFLYGISEKYISLRNSNSIVAKIVEYGDRELIEFLHFHSIKRQVSEDYSRKYGTKSYSKYKGCGYKSKSKCRKGCGYK